MKYIVYRTTCLINNYEYIGWHKTENPDIFDGYLGNSITVQNASYKLKTPKFPFHYALIKYGILNFKRETLFVFDTEKEATEKEAELVNIDYINRIDTYNVALGGSCNPNVPKKVYLFNVSGEFLNEYESSELAAKLLEGNPNSLRESIKAKGSYKEYLWSYSLNIDISEYNFKLNSKYYLYDELGNYIKEFNLAKILCDFLETDSSNICRAVKNGYKVKGYYISREKLDKFNIIISPINTQKLNQYSLDGKYIKSYKTAVQARLETGLKLCSISQAIKEGKLCNGYLWTRNDNPPLFITPYSNKFEKRKVVCYDLNGNIVETFDSISEASKKYPGCRSVLKGICKKSHNLIFKYSKN